jgi:hypothetical protein
MFYAFDGDFQGYMGQGNKWKIKVSKVIGLAKENINKNSRNSLNYQPKIVSVSGNKCILILVCYKAGYVLL